MPGRPSLLDASDTAQGEAARASAGWKLRVGELHLGEKLRLNRPPQEREKDPRQTPLSHEVGRVVAGLAANGGGGHVPVLLLVWAALSALRSSRKTWLVRQRH